MVFAYGLCPLVQTINYLWFCQSLSSKRVWLAFCAYPIRACLGWLRRLQLDTRSSYGITWCKSYSSWGWWEVLNQNGESATLVMSLLVVVFQFNRNVLLYYCKGPCIHSLSWKFRWIWPVNLRGEYFKGKQEVGLFYKCSHTRNLPIRFDWMLHISFREKTIADVRTKCPKRSVWPL